MSGNTKRTGIVRALGVVMLLIFLAGILYGYSLTDTEISGTHAIGPYQISPFYEDPETLEPGLGSTTAILHPEFYSTGIKYSHIKQKIVFAVFSPWVETPFREPVRLLTPVLFTLLGCLCIFRFAPKEKRESPIPGKILAYLAEHPGASQSQIVRGIRASRGSVSHHLRKLLNQKKVRNTSENSRSYYFLPSNTAGDFSVQSIRCREHPRSKEIFAFLAENPDVSRECIAKNLQISASVVYWHLSRMEKQQIIVKKRSGRSFVYSVSGTDSEI